MMLVDVLVCGWLAKNHPGLEMAVFLCSLV